MYEYAAEVVRVIDGDTVVLKLDLGLRISFQDSFRLAGIDTPEVRGVSAEVKAKGEAATVELERLLALGNVIVHTHKSDKYGRWLADIRVKTASGDLNVNEELVKNGFAVPYGK